MLKSMLFGRKIVHLDSWVVTLGGSGHDSANSIAVAPDSAIYVCGFTESIESGVRDALLVKYNNSGTLLWQKTLSTSSFTQVRSVAVSPDGFIYVSGSSNSLSILAKYSPSGTLQWYKVFEYKSRTIYFTSIAIDYNGYIYACGTENGGNTLLVKYDRDGVVQWKKFISGSINNSGYSVAVVPNGSTYICGYTLEPKTGHSNMFIVSCNSFGDLLWNRFISSESNSRGSSVVVAQDGHVYVCGQIGGKAFLASFSNSGLLRWQKKLSMPSSSDNQSLMVAQDGSIYVCGTAYSIATSKNEVHIEKYDSSGTLLWQNIFRGDVHIYGNSVTVGSDGTIYVCGYVESVTSGKYDLFIIKLASNISEGNETVQFGPFTLESSNHTENATSFSSKSLSVKTSDASFTEISKSLDSQESSLTSTFYMGS